MPPDSRRHAWGDDSDNKDTNVGMIEGRLCDEAERNPDFAALLREARGVADLGAQVRALRRARGWSVHELASTGGVSVEVIENVERGLQTPSLAMVWRLMDALNAVVLLGPGSSAAALDREQLMPASPPSPNDGHRAWDAAEILNAHPTAASTADNRRRRALRSIVTADKASRPPRKIAPA